MSRQLIADSCQRTRILRLHPPYQIGEARIAPKALEERIRAQDRHRVRVLGKGPFELRKCRVRSPESGVHDRLREWRDVARPREDLVGADPLPHSSVRLSRRAPASEANDAGDGFESSSIGQGASSEAMRDRQATDWSNEIINDADLGGANLEQTMAAAKQTFIDVASRTTGVNLRRLSDDLERTGMATHPDLVRIFSQVGKRLR